MPASVKRTSVSGIDGCRLMRGPATLTEHFRTGPRRLQKSTFSGLAHHLASACQFAGASGRWREAPLAPAALAPSLAPLHAPALSPQLPSEALTGLQAPQSVGLDGCWAPQSRRLLPSRGAG